MIYLKTYEARKKTEDPLYHLAVAMCLQPKIKYFYTSIRIMNKTDVLNYN